MTRNIVFEKKFEWSLKKYVTTALKNKKKKKKTGLLWWYSVTGRESLPVNAGDTGSIPALGRLHMLWSK